MSVDCKKISERVRLGADEWHEFPCSTCAKKDRNVAAVKYCVECDENLCSTCLKDHNKFASMRVHQIMNNLSSRTRQMQDLPTERCNRHGGKLIDVYCTTHDVVGCSTCFNVEQATCEGICFIPDMTLSGQRSCEISDLETKITQLLAQLDNLRQQKQDTLKLLEEEKVKLLAEIRGLRKKMNDKLDEMEKTLVTGIDTKTGTRARDARKDLDVIDNERSSLEERQKSLQSAKSGNHTEQFVQLKIGQLLVQECQRVFKTFSTGSNAVNMQVLPNSNITALLQMDDTALGSVSEILIPQSITHDRDVNVYLPCDKETCLITDICLTLKGDVYIADLNNHRIKKLDEPYTVTDYVDLPDLWGFCEVDNKRVAVTLYKKKKVQILSQNTMSLEKSFSVGDKCRGIDCHKGQLYVCCGGWREEGEGPGRIAVYSMGGELVRAYHQGASCPLYVHVSDRGDILISNAGSMNLIKLRMPDHCVSKQQIKALRKSRGMFRLSDNLFCVTGYESNNIVLIDEEGEHQQELLSKKDGITEPLAVCFDSQHSRLIVSCSESNSIKLFKVTT